MELVIARGKELVLTYGPKVIGAVVVLIVGLWIVRLLVKKLSKMMVKREVDPSLIPFATSVIGALLRIGLVLVVIQMVGIAMTSFIAVFAAAGLAVGMALSGTLQNFAGGVMILLLKPYKVGDFIKAQDHSGSVHSIQIFHTVLKTPDNKTVILPNAPVSNGPIINYSTEPQRRVDMSFRAGYDDDIDAAKRTLQELIDRDERILKEPAPLVVVGALADSSVEFTMRVWANAEDYWGIHFDMHENVKKTFDAKGFHIPFPQMGIHSN